MKGRGKGKRRERTPDEARAAATARSEGRCVGCGKKGEHDPHHLLPQREWPELASYEENVVMVCRFCHDSHERAAKRLPRSVIPSKLWEVAKGAASGKHTGGSAIAFLERTYPA